MSNENLRALLTEYSEKRASRINEANTKKNILYEKYPELEKIDKEISVTSIKNIQNILSSSCHENVEKFNKNLEMLTKKRNLIMKKFNLSESDFSPRFECNICNDTGYAKIHNRNELCSCIKQKLYNIEYNNSNIYNLKNQNFNNFRIDCYSDKVDQEKFCQSISPRENIIQIKKICEEFIDKFDDPTQDNLLFCGNPGLGKTFLSSCIANELIHKGKTVLYQTAPRMLDEIIDYKFGKNNTNILKTINNVDLLIIDDLGTETVNSLKSTEIFNIINDRLLNQNNKITKTIISTNLLLQNIFENYDERICSRIIGKYKACLFFGDDIRIFLKKNKNLIKK